MQWYKENLVSFLSLFCGFTGSFLCLSHLGSLIQLVLAIWLAWTERSKMDSPACLEHWWWAAGGSLSMCCVIPWQPGLSYVDGQQKLKLQCFLLKMCGKFHNVPPTTLLVKSSHKANRDSKGRKTDYVLTEWQGHSAKSHVEWKGCCAIFINSPSHWLRCTMRVKNNCFNQRTLPSHIKDALRVSFHATAHSDSATVSEFEKEINW